LGGVQGNTWLVTLVWGLWGVHIVLASVFWSCWCGGSFLLARPDFLGLGSVCFMCLYMFAPSLITFGHPFLLAQVLRVTLSRLGLLCHQSWS
jgi:hypothetical protein